MDPQRWRRLDQLLQTALVGDSAQREAVLTAAASEDPGLRAELEALLAGEQRAASFLESPVVGHVGDVWKVGIAERCGAELVGKRLGTYELVRVIASGGMGTVYLASRADDQFQKQVAVKIVQRPNRRERDEEMLRRFRTERQTLAGLDHPNIARLLDGGTTEDGRLYYVMEYVDGRPIDQYCEATDHAHAGPVEPDPRRRLARCLGLFGDVCSAVQYAHQHLVVHRDLKPNNILVTDDGIPKLLDFGLAKLMGSADVEHNRNLTATGEFLGTFAYAAPEQVTGAADRIDIRTDVYALGVILYQLVSGHHPYSITGSLSDVLRNITEIEPQKPSIHDKHVDDELDCIILKSIAKDQHRRYQSVEALLHDVRRYLAGEPVEAKGDSRWYILRKTTRRYKVPLAMAATLMSLICVFAVSSAVQATRVARERDRALMAEHLAADNAASLAHSLAISNIERGRLMGVSGNTPLAEELIWREYLNSGAGTTKGDGLPPESLLGGGANAVHLSSNATRAYWALWELYARQPCLTTIPCGSYRVTSVALSPTDDTIAFANGAGGIAIRGLSTGATVSLIGHTGSVPVLCFSPGGHLLASGGHDSLIKLWDIGTGECVSTLTGHVGIISTLSFSVDGRTLFSAGEDGTCRTWDTTSFQCLTTTKVGSRSGPEVQGEHGAGPGMSHELFASAGDVTRVTRWASDGSAMVSCHVGGTIRLWEPGTGRPLYTLAGHQSAPSSVSFSPDGSLIASSARDTVRLWERASGLPLSVIRGHGGIVSTIEFDNTGELLATAGMDKTIMLWSMPSCALIGSLVGHTGTVTDLAFTADGERLASGSYDHTVKIWDMNARSATRILAGHGDSVLSARFHSDGRHIVSGAGGRDSTVRVWDASTGECVQVLSGHNDAVAAVTFHPHGCIIASGSYDRTVRLWDADTGASIATLTGHDVVTSLSWRHDGDVLAVGENDGRVHLWEMPSGRLLKTLDQRADRIPSLAFSPDGKTLAVAGCYDGSIRLWDVDSGTCRRVFSAHQVAVRVLTYSPDGAMLASGGDDRAVRFWSMAAESEGVCLATLEGHKQDVFALDFSPDGRLLVSGSRGGEVKLWDVAERLGLATLPEQTAMVFAVAFSPDGRRLLCSGRDGVLTLTDLTYFNRHIQGNLDYRKALHSASAYVDLNRDAR